MNIINPADIKSFQNYLHQQERSAATIEKYTHALRQFYAWLPEDKQVYKERSIAYKGHLLAHYASSSVNGALAAINGFFKFQGWYEYQVKPLRIQRRVFSSMEKELSKAEYARLVSAAEELGKTRSALLLQLMASTGVRASEVRYVTVETLRAGQVEIHLKGKVRVILLPGKLCRKLLKYCKQEKITSGAVFQTRTGRPLDRKAIWAQLKQLCERAQVQPGKVFPHNLRHLFARVFYQAQKDIAKLADILGHSSVETTRIYLLSSGTEHRRMLESLRLLC